MGAVAPRARRYLSALAVTLAALPVIAAGRGGRRGGDGLFPSDLAGAAAACEPGLITGEVTHVRDDDTIEVAGLPVRLSGVAAPGGDRPGGAEASAAMRALVAGRTVRCELDGSRTHGRCAGVCYLGGADVAAGLVRAGLARDCPRYSGGRYADEERAAAGRGATIRDTYNLPGYCRR